MLSNHTITSRRPRFPAVESPSNGYRTFRKYRFSDSAVFTHTTSLLCMSCTLIFIFLFKGKITLRQYWFSLLSFRSPIFFLLTCKNAHTLIPFNKHTTYVLDWWVGIFEKCCFFFYFRFIHHLNGKDKNKKDLSVVYSLFSNS